LRERDSETGYYEMRNKKAHAAMAWAFVLNFELYWQTFPPATLRKRAACRQKQNPQLMGLGVLGIRAWR